MLRWLPAVLLGIEKALAHVHGGWAAFSQEQLLPSADVAAIPVSLQPPFSLSTTFLH